MFEAERALARAIVEDNALTVADRPRIRETKKDLVEGGGLLEFIPAPEGLDQVGGLREAQEVDRDAQGRASCRRPARSRSIRRKGILLLGVQGCGKSLAAKSIAATWGLPLLALDAGKLLAPFIGESERNLRDALRRVERMAPCVLWIDEIEKAFVSAALLGIRRRRLQAPDRNAADVDAGARLARLPRGHGQLRRRAAPRDDAQGPRRRGLLRRPARAADARAEIFRLHLARRGEDPARFDLAALAEAVRRILGRGDRAGDRVRPLRGAGRPLPAGHGAILVALRSTRPLSVVRGEAIGAAAWAAGRCVPRDGPGSGAVDRCIVCDILGCRSAHPRLARFRYALRRFLRFGGAARTRNLPGQYQLLLFIRSFHARQPLRGGARRAAPGPAPERRRPRSTAARAPAWCAAGATPRTAVACAIALTGAGDRRLAELVRDHCTGLDELRRDAFRLRLRLLVEDAGALTHRRRK